MEWLPLFSHSVGLGFFLTITTQKTRWLGLTALAALGLFVVMYKWMSAEWVSFVTNSAGYTGLGITVVLALACRAAVPNG